MEIMPGWYFEQTTADVVVNAIAAFALLGGIAIQLYRSGRPR